VLFQKQEVRAMLSLNLLRSTLISGAAAVFAAGATFTPAQAEEGRNAAAIAGAIGGFAAGAAVGSAAGPRHYDPPYTATTRVYRDRRVIVEDEPECRTVVTRRVNRFGERVVVRREVCD
jgi:hypothetical protein